jgi:hypothetical protein
MPYWVYGRDSQTGERRDPLFIETDDEVEARTVAAEAGMAIDEVEAIDRVEPSDGAAAIDPPPWLETGDWPGSIRPGRPPWRAAAKRATGAILGVGIAFLGAYLRLSAHTLAWPASDSYTGPREATEWAIAERAYQDLGLIALVFGLVMILLVFVNWLWDRPRRGRGRRRRQGHRRYRAGTDAGPRPAG